MLDRNMQQKNGLKNSDPALKLPASFINCPPHYKQSIYLIKLQKQLVLLLMDL